MKQFIFILILAFVFSLEETNAQKTFLPEKSIYPFYIDVTKYPDYSRRQFHVPSWETFDNKVHLVGKRYGITTSNIPGIVGDILRPNLWWPQRQGSELQNLCNAINNAGKYVWNVGGYIPELPDHAGSFYYSSILKSQELLGDRFIGMDVGEQDGRYVWQYNSQYYLSYDQKEEYQKFHRMFTKVTEDQGDKMTLLTTLWGWHYPVKDGVSMIQAAETQNKAAVTSAQVQYSFLRGACKQYGTLLGGDVSIFTTWNNYWASYSLKKKISCTQYQYNAAILGFEDTEGSGLKDELVEFINNGHKRAGTMHAPVAFMLDFYNGWMPGFWWSGQYMKWCWLPYEQGDYLTHDLFSLIYPKYEDNGVFRNETKVIVPTPFGDMFDVLLSDASVPVMEQYPLIVVAGDMKLTAGTELKDKIESYVDNGGNFVVTAENAKEIWPEWEISDRSTMPASAEVVWETSSIQTNEILPIEFYKLNESALPEGFYPRASWDGNTIVYDIPLGDGFVTLSMCPWGLNKNKISVSQRAHPYSNEVQASSPLGKPYVLARHFKDLLTEKFTEQRLISVGNDNHLSYITNYQGNNQYLVGITNTTLFRQNFNLECYMGIITNMEEWILPDHINDDDFYPEGYSSDGLPNTENAIAGFDTRLFLLTIDPDTSSFKTMEAASFPDSPKNRMIRFKNLNFVQEEILDQPTFFDHFDGVLIDYKDIYKYEKNTLQLEARWLNRQNLRFVIDFRSGVKDEMLNMKYDTTANSGYLNTLKVIETVFDKMQVFDHAEDILLAVNKNHGAEGLVRICELAKKGGIKVHVNDIDIGDVWTFEQRSLDPWKEVTSSAHVAITTENVRNGNFALKLEGAGVATAELLVPVEPDTWYIFGGSLRVSLNQLAYIGVKGYGGDSISQSFTGDGIAYHENMMTFRTGKDVSEITVFIRKSENTELANADDMFFTKFSSDSPPTPVTEITSNKKSVQIYPNPTTGKLFIVSETEVDTVIIRNLSGKLIIKSEQALKTKQCIIDIEHIKKGYYIVQIESDGHSFVRKIVKI